MPAQSDAKSAEVVKKLQAGAVPHGLTVPGMAEGTALRDHQKTAVAFLALTERAFLFDVMGSGKTASSIGFVQFLSAKEPNKPYPKTVIVTTAPNVRSSWQIDGFERFFPGVKIAVARGTKKQRRKVYEDTSWDVLITAYSTVRDDREDITRLKFSIAILDECDILGNPNSLVTQATRELVKDCGRCVGMTGTPFTEKRLMKFHSIMEVIGISREFASSRSAFERYHHEVKFEEMWVKRRNKRTGEMEPKKIKVKVLGNLKNVNEFREKIKPYYLRRTHKDLGIALPELKSINKYLDPTPEQERLYKQAQQGFIKSGQSTVREIERVWEHLRAICNNAALVGGKDSSAKADWIEQKLLSDLSNDQVVIFNDRLQSVELLEKKLTKAGIGFTTIIGATTEKRRLEAVKRFRTDSSCQVLLGTRTLVRGLNLQNARAQINVSLMPNPGEVEQVAYRIVRDGSVHKEALVISLFILNTMEAGWYKHVAGKQGVSDYVLQDSAGVFKPLSPKEMHELILS